MRSRPRDRTCAQWWRCSAECPLPGASGLHDDCGVALIVTFAAAPLFGTLPLKVPALVRNVGYGVCSMVRGAVLCAAATEVGVGTLLLRANNNTAVSAVIPACVDVLPRADALLSGGHFPAGHHRSGARAPAGCRRKPARNDPERPGAARIARTIAEQTEGHPDTHAHKRARPARQTTSAPRRPKTLRCWQFSNCCHGNLR